MLIKIPLLTISTEAAIVLDRKFFGSMRKYYKHKIRIHHGYTGILCVIISLFRPADALLIFGSAMFFSDLIHHFVVLPAWIKSREFP